MLKLYRDPGYSGLPGGASPYLVKLETWLRLAGISYEVEIMPITKLVESAPRGLVPFVDLDGERMDDSNTIIDQLKKLHGDPLRDDRLTRAQHAQGGLIKSMCEHELFAILAYGRFGGGDQRAWCEYILADDNVPDDQRDAMFEQFTSSVEEKMNIFRIGRYGADFANEELRKCLEILSFLLADGPWLFGDEPSTYDCSFFGFMSSFVHFPVTSNVQVKTSRKFANIVEYCDRVREQVYDYEPEDKQLA